MKKIILLFLLTFGFSNLSLANLSKCAHFVVGMQADVAISDEFIIDLGNKVGLTYSEYLACRAHIDELSTELRMAVFEIID